MEFNQELGVEEINFDPEINEGMFRIMELKELSTFIEHSKSFDGDLRTGLLDNIANEIKYIEAGIKSEWDDLNASRDSD